MGSNDVGESVSEAEDDILWYSICLKQAARIENGVSSFIMVEIINVEVSSPASVLPLSTLLLAGFQTAIIEKEKRYRLLWTMTTGRLLPCAIARLI